MIAMSFGLIALIALLVPIARLVVPFWQDVALSPLFQSSLMKNDVSDVVTRRRGGKGVVPGTFHTCEIKASAQSSFESVRYWTCQGLI